MKPTTLLLAASLLANAALISLLSIRSSPPAAGPLNSTLPKAGSGAQQADDLRAALASGDAKALEAAGISPAIARELSIGRIFARLADKMHAGQAKAAPDGRWWRSRGNIAPGMREQQLLARREFSEALTAAFGDDLGLSASDPAQLAFLSPEKRDALRRINQDYDEMMAKFSAGGLQLASDREKLKLLRQERDRDIAALLSPEERDAYEMRTSVSGNTVRARYGDAIESEAEFQKIYALQKAFDEKFPREALNGRISPEVIRARNDAERQLESDIRTAVGDDHYAALRRAADPDVRTLDSLATRLSLPASTTDTVLTSRDTYSTESQRIINDTSVPMPQRRTEIQALATQAKAELARTLGSEGADAYAQRSPWLNMLQSGMAYSTTPQDGAPGSLAGANQSVYPVMPAGANAPGAQRQFFISATAPAENPVGGDTFTGAGGGGGNVQVVTYSTSTVTDHTTTPAGGSVQKQIVVPSGQNPPAGPPPAAPPKP